MTEFIFGVGKFEQRACDAVEIDIFFHVNLLEQKRNIDIWVGTDKETIFDGKGILLEGFGTKSIHNVKK